MIRPVGVAGMAAITLLLGAPGHAGEFSARLFGHEVAIASDDEGERLRVDGREILRDRYVRIEEIGLAAGMPVAIGSASNGGNACEGGTFVLSFPAGAAPRLDGPTDQCSAMTAELRGDGIHLSTAAFPGQDGERWLWTPDGSFRQVGTVAFRPDEARGWAELRERTAGHPSDLFDYGEVARRIGELAGADLPLVQRIFTGVGSAEFRGDWFIGTSCTPHNCGTEEGIVAASLASRELYLAWKPEGGKIVVRPAVGEWPEQARSELRAWAAKWK